jgi:hypothetical protein
MALIAVDTSQLFDFISKFDPEKHDRAKATIFHVSPIPGRFLEDMRSKNNVMLYDPQKPNQEAKIQFSGAMHVDVVRHGLKGFTNFLDRDGRPVEFKTKKVNVQGRTVELVSDMVLDSMPLNVIEEMSEFIQSLTRLPDPDAEDEKPAAPVSDVDDEEPAAPVSDVY